MPTTQLATTTTNKVPKTDPLSTFATAHAHSQTKSAGGSPTKTDAALKKPEKKSTSSMTIRPEKNQGAKIADKTKK